MSSEAKKTEGEKKKRKERRSWRDWSYTTRLALSFAFISAMAILVAFGGLSLVWDKHFEAYTQKNLQTTADSTAAEIAERYDAAGGWSSSAISPAESATQLNDNLGIRVVDEDGIIRFDAERTAYSSGLGPQPSLSESVGVVTSDINSSDGTIGYVQMWVYGSDTFLTQADRDFRQLSYSAMIAALILAVLLSLLVGQVFARTLVRPINRMTKTARAIKEGDLSARTGLSGSDEVSRLGEMFDEMAEAVERDRQMERRLTTDVAHELRTPLMAIQSTVEAMVDGVFEPNEERLSTVNAEVQRLSRLVDALLKLSRLENRKTPMKKERLDLGELIGTIVSTHEAYVRDAGLELIFKKDEGVYVYADPDMMRQATANLISNAVCYTDEGTITVTVTKSANMAQISVADTGIGLSPEEARMVFSRFWRAESSRDRAQGGLGVGLSVVKEIVDRHNGYVRVDGKKGEGATFAISIPLYDESREKKTEAAKDRERGNRSRRGNRRDAREEKHD